MKVWELIADLAKYQAGDDVCVGTPHTQYAAIVRVCKADDGKVGIDAQDSEAVDSEGNEVGLLSTVVNACNRPRGAGR